MVLILEYLKDLAIFCIEVVLLGDGQCFFLRIFKVLLKNHIRFSSQF